MSAASDAFDASRARLKGPDYFPRFRAPAHGPSLRDAELDDDEMLLVIAEAQTRVAFVLRQMAYFHLAQGELHGKPYLVSF